MKILMVASECVPFAKTGGLADVVYSLSRELEKRGDDVRILMPGYSFLDKKIFESSASLKISVPSQFRKERVTIRSAFLPDSSIKVYFLSHPLFRDRTGMYGDKDSPSYRDNHRRFILLNRAVFPLCEKTGWIPDVIHAHDWQAALIPSYLNNGEGGELFRKVKSVLTIHNIGYQGIFSKHDIHASSLPWSAVSNTKAGYNDSLNFLKAGILNSDLITTVSPKYAEEIKTPSFGEGLENFLREREERLFGILNGADYSQWNPERDPHIPVHFSADKTSGKEKLKEIIKKRFGLPVEEDLPLIGMVSRLASQKGFNELCGSNGRKGALECILEKEEVQIIILGTGEKWIEDALLKLQSRFKNLRVKIDFDNELAHLIEAGSDFFLMPSRYEPCGLNQIYSLKYGTIPIVTETGGLSDSVTDYFADPDEGTGFYIPDFTAEAVCSSTEKAVRLWYTDRNKLKEIMKRGMKKDFSWKESAEKYRSLYRKIIAD